MSLFGDPDRTLFHAYGDVDAGPDGRPLIWPGGPTGLPVLGRPGGAGGPTSRAEYDALPVVARAGARWFRMDDPDDAAGYDQVCGRIANGWYVLVHCERHVTHLEGFAPVMHIWMEWREYHHELPRRAEVASALRAMLAAPGTT